MRIQLAVMVAAAILAAAVGVLAVVDHRHTRTQLDRAQVFLFYCDRRQIYCDEKKPDPIHESWETHEYTYGGAEALFAAAFVGGGLSLLRSRRAS
jgi:hypothetical protein